jgi:glycosyltransferase involved in cell wall biosynthesis
MEAGLYAVPSIVTNCGGLPEIVTDSQTGYLVPSRSPEAIAEKIAAFYKQPGSLQAMGIQASADYRKRFSRDRQVGAFTQVIHQIAPA